MVDAPLGRTRTHDHVLGVQEEGRLKVLLVRNDLGGALARGPDGLYTYPCTPGGPEQREWAIRFAVNILLYATCTDYKADRAHVETLCETAAGADLPDMKRHGTLAPPRATCPEPWRLLAAPHPRRRRARRRRGRSSRSRRPPPPCPARDTPPPARPAPARRRRLLAIGLELTLSHETVQKTGPRVAVLVDTSASMALADADRSTAPKTARLDRLRALGRRAPPRARLARAGPRRAGAQLRRSQPATLDEADRRVPRRCWPTAPPPTSPAPSPSWPSADPGRERRPPPARRRPDPLRRPVRRSTTTADPRPADPGRPRPRRADHHRQRRRPGDARRRRRRASTPASSPSSRTSPSSAPTSSPTASPGSLAEVDLRRDGAVVATTTSPRRRRRAVPARFEVAPDRVGQFVYEIAVPRSRRGHPRQQPPRLRRQGPARQGPRPPRRRPPRLGRARPADPARPRPQRRAAQLLHPPQRRGRRPRGPHRRAQPDRLPDRRALQGAARLLRPRRPPQLRRHQPLRSASTSATSPTTSTRAAPSSSSAATWASPPATTAGASLAPTSRSTPASRPALQTEPYRPPHRRRPPPPDHRLAGQQRPRRLVEPPRARQL
jgi:hypothetical protein